MSIRTYAKIAKAERIRKPFRLSIVDLFIVFFFIF